MKIRAFIEKLSAVEKNVGDTDVIFELEDGCCVPVSDLEITKGDGPDTVVLVR